MFSNVSLSAEKVDNVFLFILSICIFLLILITGCMIYFVIKYNRKRHPVPVNIEGNITLEIIWTIIPTILVLAMFFYGWSGYTFLRTVPKGAMVVNVTARMWSWSFEYENGKKSDVLNVSVGKPVKLLLYSKDVIHGFYVPAFRIQQDIVPGMETYVWFQATKEGSYDILCSQFCGYKHSAMLSKVNVMSEKDFAKWYENKTDVSVSSGFEILKENGCLTCHGTDGAIATLGPTFKGLFNSNVTVITNGKKREIKADEEYIRTSILDPDIDLVSGFENIKMPSGKNMFKKEELDEIIKYLKELK